LLLSLHARKCTFEAISKILKANLFPRRTRQAIQQHVIGLKKKLGTDKIHPSPEHPGTLEALENYKRALKEEKQMRLYGKVSKKDESYACYTCEGMGCSLCNERHASLNLKKNEC
jgi:hypothetical protein